MPSTSYIDGVSPFVADSANAFNRLHYTIFGDPADLPAVKSLLHASPGAIGGTTPAAGTFTALSCTSLLVNGAPMLTTGDAKLTLKTTADTGWVMFNDGTMGNAASGGTSRANADTVDLYTLLWNGTANADCAVSTGRGLNAAADFAANKTIALPKVVGRALAIYGSGSGLTGRALALATGAETVALSTGEMPSHNHGPSAGTNFAGSDGTTGLANAAGPYYQTTAIGSVTTSTGGGSAHNNMQPTAFLNAMVKL